MEDILRILYLLFSILFRPREAAKSKALIEYNKNLLRTILTILILYFFYIYLKTRIDTVALFIVLALLIPVIQLAINYGANLYKYIIVSVVHYDIPHDIFQKILLPYLLAAQIMAITLLYINTFTNLYLRNLIFQIPIIWFNIQVYIIVKYRIYYIQEMDQETKKELAKKLLFLSLIIVFVTVISPYIQEHQRLKNDEKQKIMIEQDSLIRKEVFAIYQEVFNEVRIAMEKGKYIDDAKRSELNNKIISYHLKIGSMPTTREEDLKEYINSMMIANKGWYLSENRDTTAAEQYIKDFNNAMANAKFIIENYKQFE